MDELRQRDAVGPAGGPADQNARGRDDGDERQEEWRQVGSMGAGGAQEIDDRQVPQAPGQAEQQGARSSPQRACMRGSAKPVQPISSRKPAIGPKRKPSGKTWG